MERDQLRALLAVRAAIRRAMGSELQALATVALEADLGAYG